MADEEQQAQLVAENQVPREQLQDQVNTTTAALSQIVNQAVSGVVSQAMGGGEEVKSYKSIRISQT